MHQNMMHNAIPKICGEDLPQFRFLGKKADKTTGTIDAVREFIRQFQQLPFLIHLETQGVYGVPFVLSTVTVLPVNIFKGK